MSKQVISSTKITKSYQISKSGQNYNESQKNFKNDKNESFPQSKIEKGIQNKFTGQAISNLDLNKDSDYSLSIKTGKKAFNRKDLLQNYKIDNLDSSLGSIQQRSVNNQSACTCGKFKTDTHSTYNNTIQTNLTGEGYCTCDDGKDNSNGCTCYKRNTNKTFNRTLNLNDQNIFIQEGSNSDYCNCDEREERKIFSNVTSDYNTNLPNVLTDEEINLNYCTCGQNHKSTIETSSKKGQFSKNQNLLQYSSNIMTTSNNELPIQTTDFEEREINRKNIVKKIKNTQVNIDIMRKEVREKIRQELKKQREENNEQNIWNGEIHIQVIERLQYLTAQPPALRVQFLNDMMIKRTINRDPIHVLIPIPDNYIQKQEMLQVLSEQKEEKDEEKNPNDDLCPENVDLLNISHAYSIPVPSFNDLEIENEEMFITGQPKIEPEFTVEQYSLYCQGKDKEPFTIENYAWDINPSERLWSGVMRPVRVNKLEIEVQTKDWNNLEKEFVSDLNVEIRKDEEPKERKEAIFRKNKFTLTFKQNRKHFKKIDIGDNEIITLKSERRVLESKPGKTLEQSEKTNIALGGPGFNENKYKWSPVPFNAISINIDKTKVEAPLENISLDKLDIPAAKKRREDWNLVNNLSNESTVNILTKEKILSEERIEAIASIAEGDSNKWNDKIRRQKNVKLGFGPSKKSFVLNICKEIDIIYEQEADDVIINDDYNNVKGPEMRPITATIIKVKEEDDTSSVASYDVFQNLVIRKSNFDLNFTSFPSFGEQGNPKVFKIRKSSKAESEQKNKYDKTVKNIAIQTKKIIGKINGNNNLIEKKKKIDFIREEPEETNYLRI